MPRTNLEDEALPRVTKLSEIMACTYREALGTVMSLWRESQTVLSVEGSKEDIIDWAWLHGLVEPDQDRWLKGLVRARILTKTEHETYKIRGNENQIESRVSKLHSSAKGGEATKRRWAKIKEKLATRGQKKADSYPTASAEHAETTQRLGTNQDKTDQDRPIQFNSNQDKTDQAEAKPIEVTADGVSLSVVDPLLVNYLRDGGVTAGDYKRWLSTYRNGEWLVEELRKAMVAWSGRTTHPGKLAKSLNTWLEKGRPPEEELTPEKLRASTTSQVSA